MRELRPAWRRSAACGVGVVRFAQRNSIKRCLRLNDHAHQRTGSHSDVYLRSCGDAVGGQSLQAIVECDLIGEDGALRRSRVAGAIHQRSACARAIAVGALEYVRGDHNTAFRRSGRLLATVRRDLRVGENARFERRHQQDVFVAGARNLQVGK